MPIIWSDHYMLYVWQHHDVYQKYVQYVIKKIKKIENTVFAIIIIIFYFFSIQRGYQLFQPNVTLEKQLVQWLIALWCKLRDMVKVSITIWLRTEMIDTVTDVFCWLALSIQPHLFQLPSVEVGKLKLMYLILSGNCVSGY